jgi:hypothetical protein
LTEYVGAPGKIERAKRVERILKDEEFIAAFENTRQAIFHQIERTPIRDTDGLGQLRLCLKLLNDVRANLEQVLSDGKVAEFNLKQEKERRFSLFRGNK